jgi:hypothetical protein
LLEFLIEFLYTDRMKNNEQPIDGFIFNNGISVRSGNHGYGTNSKVVEIIFRSEQCNNIVVIDMKTALELQKQLVVHSLIPLY